MGNWESEHRTIRERGLRATASRAAVLRLVRTASAPLTHAEVAHRLAKETWDKATLYRNLVDLADVGLLRRISLSDGVRFEDVNDHPGKTPVHFVCSRCEVVQCLTPWSFIAPEHAHFPRALAAGNVEIQIRGLCDRCSS